MASWTLPPQGQGPIRQYADVADAVPFRPHTRRFPEPGVRFGVNGSESGQSACVGEIEAQFRPWFTEVSRLLLFPTSSSCFFSGSHSRTAFSFGWAPSKTQTLEPDPDQ